MTPFDKTSPELIKTLTGHVLVFDSGVGGLTIAEELKSLAPNLAIDYSADTGFFPYGDKSNDALRERLPIVTKALYDHINPDVFVIACNTASTLALEDVRKVLPCPVVGTVPAIKPAVLISKTGTIGLLATPGTLKRSYTDKLIADYASGTRVLKHGSVALVRLAEDVARGETPDLTAFYNAQKPLFDAPDAEEMDTIVLACTHFPLVREQLIASAPRPVSYIDSGSAIARQTLRLLQNKTNLTKAAGHQAYITDDTTSHHLLSTVFQRFGFRKMHTLTIGTSPAV